MLLLAPVPPGAAHAAGGSWADGVLGTLGYNSRPARLQALIRRVYAMATTQVRVPGTTVLPCPLFDVLDSSPASRDYVARVEPSAEGGIKMANWFVDAIVRHTTSGSSTTGGSGEAAGAGAASGAAAGGAVASAAAGGAGTASAAGGGSAAAAVEAGGAAGSAADSAVGDRALTADAAAADASLDEPARRAADATGPRSTGSRCTIC